MKPERYVLLIHLTGWIAFILLPVILFPVPPVFDKGRMNHFILDLLASNLVLIGTFYLNYIIWVPRFLLSRRIPEFILFNLLMLAVLAFARWVILPGRVPGPPEPGRPPEEVLMNGATAFRYLVVVLMAIGIRVYVAWRNAQSAAVTAELSYLKAQINPHFLFNTLNGIYGLSIKGSEQTPDAILRLSSIMRYVITEAEQPKVPVSKEIRYLEDYIALQRLRLPPGIRLDIKFPDPAPAGQIAPLLLVSFVENAFKYGVSAEHESVIRIHVSCSSEKLMLQVENRIFRNSAPADDEHGIGLSNTRKRLELLYPGKHELLVQDTGSTFLVGLTIQLL